MDKKTCITCKYGIKYSYSNEILCKKNCLTKADGYCVSYESRYSCPITKNDCPYNKEVVDNYCDDLYKCSDAKKAFEKNIRKTSQQMKLYITSICIFLLVGILCLSLFTNQRIVPFENNDAPVIKSQPLRPEKISIPSLNASGDIVKVTLDQNQYIRTLPVPEKAFWYEDSSIAGLPGNCIIVGLKYLRGITGIFYGIENLKEEDEIHITLDNGDVILQKVYMVKIFKDGILSNDVFSSFHEHPITTLISNTGSFDQQTNTYRDIVVVWAK